MLKSGRDRLYSGVARIWSGDYSAKLVYIPGYGKKALSPAVSSSATCITLTLILVLIWTSISSCADVRQPLTEGGIVSILYNYKEHIVNIFYIFSIIHNYDQAIYCIFREY